MRSLNWRSSCYHPSQRTWLLYKMACSKQRVHVARKREEALFYCESLNRTSAAFTQKGLAGCRSKKRYEIILLGLGASDGRTRMQALNVQRESWIQLRKPKPAAEAGQQKREREREKSGEWKKSWKWKGRRIGGSDVGERASSFHVSLLAVGRHRN